jgi:hypothetical protein
MAAENKHNLLELFVGGDLAHLIGVYGNGTCELCCKDGIALHIVGQGFNNLNLVACVVCRMFVCYRCCLPLWNRIPGGASVCTNLCGKCHD